MANAVPIDHPNQRPVEIDADGSVVYRIRGTDTYLKVFGERKASRAASPQPLFASVTYAQTCGVNVYNAGLRVAELRNRANVTYHTGQTRAPATFNWMDMKGTRTLSVLYSWNSLNQFAHPGLRIRFETYGYTQASANLARCIAGVCRTDYFVSRLLVKTSGTSCQ